MTRFALLPLLAITLLACQSEDGHADQPGAGGSAPNGTGGELATDGGNGASASGGNGAGASGGTGGQVQGLDGGPANEAGPESPPEGGTAPDGSAEPTSDCQQIEPCVCDDWEQDQCCSGGWDTFCQVIAEQKCGATVECGGAAQTDAGDAAAKGACCEARDEPGCSDPEVESCVCELLPDCCENAWDALCVQLYNEQHCSDGVRECVCEDWEQDQCCTQAWTTLCALTAEEKCEGTPSCG